MSNINDSLNSTPSAERIHIGFFGMMNAGKSSIVNAVTGQDLAVVSDVKGTTTDPVKKNMELLPLGPVVIIDTPGIDDEGGLGSLRVKKAREVLSYVDIAVLVVDANISLQKADLDMISAFIEKDIPFVVAYNKTDLFKHPLNNDRIANLFSLKSFDIANLAKAEYKEIFVSATKNTNIYQLKELIASFAPSKEKSRYLISDIIQEKDIVVLVTPIDSSAPKGRIILPQQQTIRDILDKNAISMVVQVSEIKDCLDSLKNPPALVITDSKVFKEVDAIIPKDQPLSSFSILFARYKGDLKTVVNGAYALDSLNDKDKILISEGCTHHRQCEDIGTVKLPTWIKNYTKKDLIFEFTQGKDFPEDLSPYSLIVHCGACMLNEREMQSRLKKANLASIPMTNYGVLIAHINGILKRSIEPFGDNL